jgi:hypothetical protein
MLQSLRKNALPLAALTLAAFAVVTNPGTKSFAQDVLNYMAQGGALWVVGGELDINGTLKINGVAAKSASGQATTATASDTIATGLTKVTSCSATLDGGPLVDPEMATCSIGDQNGSPVSGSILIQTWKTFGGTPAASATFSKKVNWVAIGS